MAVLASRMYQIWYVVVSGKAKLKSLVWMAATMVKTPRLMMQMRSTFSLVRNCDLPIRGMGTAK